MLEGNCSDGEARKKEIRAEMRNLSKNLQKDYICSGPRAV